MIEKIISAFGDYFPEINNAIGVGLVVLARVLGFLKFAPGFARKDVPSMIRISFALLFTIMLTSIVDIPPFPKDTSLALVISLNVIFGAFIAFIANCILQIAEAAGDMINMQMGLSAAQVLDPASGQQTSLMGKCFSQMAIVLFINLGGFYWLFNAFVRSFEIFPVYATGFNITDLINMKYLVTITSNILYVGLQLASPVLLATLGQDIILGIISRTAPQVNVFQMSFLFKPVFGAAIVVWLLTSMAEIIDDYFLSFCRIF